MKSYLSCNVMIFLEIASECSYFLFNIYLYIY